MARSCSSKAMVENLKRKLWGNTDISFKKDPFELDNLYYIKSVQCAVQKWSPATNSFAKKPLPSPLLLGQRVLEHHRSILFYLNKGSGKAVLKLFAVI